MNTPNNFNLSDKLFVFYNHKILRKIKKILYAPYKLRIKKYCMRADFQYGLNTFPRQKRIIVSLTSFPPRFRTLPLCLKSLSLQTIKPDKILVYLGTDTTVISDELLGLEKYGIEFIKTDDNLMPHQKYFYAMQSFPDDIIITVDDDCIYSKNLVKSLLKAHKKHPHCVAAVRVHKMAYSHGHTLLSYNNWINNYTFSRKPSYKLFATGVGGVLYPPGSLPKETFDAGTIKRYCLKADDIWLKFMQLLNRTKVVSAPLALFYSPEPYEINEPQFIALNKSNVAKMKNDAFISALKDLYCFDPLVHDIMQTADSRQQTADSRQQTADSRQQTADSRQQTADSRQQTADSRQQNYKRTLKFVKHRHLYTYVISPLYLVTSQFSIFSEISKYYEAKPLNNVTVQRNQHTLTQASGYETLRTNKNFSLSVSAKYTSQVMKNKLVRSLPKKYVFKKVCYYA